MSLAAPEITVNPDFRVEVHTSHNRGFTPEEVADRCANRIIAVGDNAPLAIQAQARSFRSNIVKVIEFYMREAIKSDRTSVYNALIDAGHKDLANLIRRM